MILGENPVGWVERSEPHQKPAEFQLVGLTALDPPYHFTTFRNKNNVVKPPTATN